MSKSKFGLLVLFLLCSVFFVSCERYPIEALVGVPARIDSWPDPWYIFDDQINTRGSMEPYRWKDSPYCANWDKVSLSFSFTHGTKRGYNCMMLSWIGNVNDPGKSFFGFGLQSREQSGGKVALGKAGYTSLKFWIKGELYDSCTFEISVPGTSVTGDFGSTEITSEWQEKTVPMNLSSTAEVEYLISFALKTSGKTNGGTVYLDDIRFVK